MSLVVTRAQSRYRRSPSRLPFEALLSIFSNLDSREIVVMRRCCKRWKEIIDNNKSLWRVLEWIQQRTDSPTRALEMFDEKSASTLRQVSIFRNHGHSYPLLEILDRSKNSLTDLSLKLYYQEAVSRHIVIEIASNSPLLKSLVIWPSDGYWIPRLPKTRLTRSCTQTPLDATRASNLQVLWHWKSVKDWESKEDILSSLVSFADPVFEDLLQLRSFICNFSQTITHLSTSFHSQNAPSSLSCPNLSVLEGHFHSVFPSWLDAPNLRVVIATNFNETTFETLPVSTEELWLLREHYSEPDPDFSNLQKVCPNLKILKIAQELLERRPRQGSLVSALRARERLVKEGFEIAGIKMKSLEKLVVQTDLFEPAQLDELRSLVGIAIEIKDYPDFIELEY